MMNPQRKVYLTFKTKTNKKRNEKKILSRKYLYLINVYISI